MEKINELITGNRVWTIRGYDQHGQTPGSKVDVPPNIGGTVICVEQRICYLYVVKWDTGQITKHYSNELFSIGLFQNINDLEVALRSGKNGKLTLGPAGGFRGFILTIHYNGNEYLFELYKGETLGWMILSASFKKQEIVFETEILA